MSYILYINQPQKVTEIPLPAVDNRKIELDISEACRGCVLELEVFDGRWKMLASDKLKLSVDGDFADSTDIADSKVIRLYPEGEGSLSVIVKDVVAEKNTFVLYDISDKNRVTIGCERDNDIVINDEYVTAHHAVIIPSESTLADNSTNGTFVNGRRVSGSVVLSGADTIYIVGHKIIFLGNTVAICKNDAVDVKLDEAETEKLVNTESYSDKSFFSRAPRRIEPLDDEVVEIEDPPAKQKIRNQPLIFIIGPSVTMPLPILVSVLVNIAAGTGGIKSGTMYLGTLLSVLLSALVGTGWALAHQIYNKKMVAADEKERTEAYSSYIDNNKRLLEEKHEKNKRVLENSFISSTELKATISAHPELIWNRNMYQKDFLSVRLGKGKMKMPGGISVSKQRFSLNDDELCKYPHKLHDEYELMDNCVSLLNIANHKIIGVVGDEKRIPLIANNIICQLAATHCYTDVKLAMLCGMNEKSLYSWVRWLPHTAMSNSPIRFVGCDSESHKNVIHIIASELRKRAEAENKNRLHLPHIVLFCTSPEIINDSIISKYISSNTYLGITFVLLYEQMNSLPNECKAVIESSSNFSGFYMLDGEINDENKIEFDTISVCEAEALARQLCGYYVTETANSEIPSSVDYFDMLGIGNIEQWNLIKKYKENRSYEGLKSFIGLGLGGRDFVLDIHEKKHGPHGLVAGTTGSGKSETLQTLILSLAMNYSPDEVAFVLIDYKGGGMANAFSGMPHVAGMITNLTDEAGGLDNSMTRRACCSLRSEITRRQTILDKYKLNHVDAYMRLFREGKAEEAMPHLIIISDEFAELKKEQPEFIKELISVSRVGRSLGIHLILATQKPTGVVDDEIWSNSRFKLCLRVQDKQDSMGMLKRPDAAYLTDAGRTFVQIGNDELFEEVQAGYSGAEYLPKEKVISANDSEASMLEIDGTNSVVHTVRHLTQNAVTQLETAVKYISRVTSENKISSVKPLWLSPLSGNIVLDDIPDTKFDGLTAVYGMVDDFEKQNQYPAAIDVLSCSNVKIAGLTGCGKTTLLQTVICSLVNKYTPEQFVFYVMDFSGRTFRSFRTLPHCGGVVFEEEAEAVERLINLVLDIIEERKLLFDRNSVGSYKEYIKISTLPIIMVAIDNFAVFNELYPELEEKMLRMMREGVKYGIRIWATVNTSSDLKYKMKAYMTESIVLRFNERSEYSEFIGRNPEFIPKNINGRGLVVLNGAILEFQTALPAKGENEFERIDILKRRFEEFAEKYKDMERAAAIPIIPKNESFSTFADKFGLGRDNNILPIGYDKENIKPFALSLADTYCYCVSDNGTKGIALFISNIVSRLSKSKCNIKLVKLDERIAVKTDGAEMISTLDDIFEMLVYLKAEFKERSDARKAFLAENPNGDSFGYMAENFERIVIFIDNMTDFCNLIYNQTEKENMSNITELFFNQGKGLNIFFFAGFDSNRKTYLTAANIFRMENCGIHFGGRTDNQNTLNINIPVAEKIKQLAYNEGYSVVNENAVKIYMPEADK